MDSDEKRILVLAGAGSGKTNTLIEKIKYYIKEKDIPAK
ncbi:UvrD-helicase domain-containing protein [Chitinophaga sp. LS1]